MEERYRYLIEYLYNFESYITSDKIVKELHLSKRTIRNYVAEINNRYEEKIIISDRSGYKLNHAIVRKLNLLNSADILPQNFEQRTNYLIKIFLVDHEDAIDIYEYSERILMSVSSIKADLSKLNQLYKDLNVKFKIKNNKIFLIGNEADKKRLLSRVIRSEAPKGYLSIEMLNRIFSGYDVNKIVKILTDSFMKYGYYVNELNELNLILHILIVIDSHREQSDSNCIYDDHEDKLIKEIINQLEDNLQCSFDINEQHEIAALLTSAINTQFDSDHVRETVDERYFQIVKECIKGIADNYFIDLNHMEFIVPFALHLKSSTHRYRNNIQIFNPLLPVIRTNSPLIYDLALFASIQINRYLNIKLNDHEISFIALHIGGEIERQNSNENKLKVVLLSPNYLNMSQNLYNQIMIHFGQFIEIISIKNIIESFDFEEADFIITVMDIINLTSARCVLISSSLSNHDLIGIHTMINDLNEEKKKEALFKNFDNYFYKDLFWISEQVISREEIIALAAKKMEKMSLVESDFEKDVLERESMASTSFGNIAIPHSIKMNAKKTAIGVFLSKNGIEWQDKTVNYVFVMATSQEDSKIFGNVYESLIAFFDDHEMNRQMLAVNSFEDFKNTMISLI